MSERMLSDSNLRCNRCGRRLGKNQMNGICFGCINNTSQFITLKEFKRRLDFINQTYTNLFDLITDDEYKLTNDFVECIDELKEILNHVYTQNVLKGVFEIRYKNDRTRIVFSHVNAKLAFDYLTSNNFITRDAAFNATLRKNGICEMFFMPNAIDRELIGYVRDSDRRQASNWIDLVDYKLFIKICNEHLKEKDVMVQRVTQTI